MTTLKFKPRNAVRWFVWGSFALVLLVLPLLFRQGFALTLMSQMGIMIIFALSYNMLLGQTGLLSFGHAVYSGLGAYFAIHALALIGSGALVFPVSMLPLVGGAAGLAFGAAVLLVACSCSIALATPIALLATIGANAKRGVLIKGGKYLETLARADVLLIDKTGTLTLGKPPVTDIAVFPSPFGRGGREEGFDEQTLLSYAASADRFSEHPLAEALRRAANERGLRLFEVTDFESLAGMGARATVNGKAVSVGRGETVNDPATTAQIEALEAQGKTVIQVSVEGKFAGVVAASDTLRSEVPEAMQAARQAGIQKIELLTGDNERVASSVAGALGISHRAGLLPEDKIRIVKECVPALRRPLGGGSGLRLSGPLPDTSHHRPDALESL